MSRIGPAGSWPNWIVAACIVGLPISVRGENEGELLALVKAGHRSAQESIQSLSCTVSIDSDFPTHSLVLAGKYWRFGNVARIEEQVPTGTVDYFYMGSESEVRHVVRNRPGTGQPEWAVGRRLFNDLAHPLDVWRLMLLEFELLLPAAKSTARVKREKIAGRNCIRVSIDIRSETELTFWLDVGRNYLVWKRVMTTKGDRNEDEILEFIEPQPGVYFPTKRGSTSFHGREQRGHGFITLSDIRINELIPKDLFQLPAIPRGTICNDWINKQKYPIDGSWQQVPGSQSEAIERYALPSAASGSGGSFTAQSTAEPKSWIRWIAPVSLTVLVLASAAWLYRRYRARSLEAA